MQSQVMFNRVPKKVPGGFGTEAGQVQQGSSGAGPREGFGNLWCRAMSGSTVQQGFQRLDL